MTIQIITLIITLIAVIVGPMVTYRITKKNLKFKYLSVTQGKWIEKLEESSHSFLNNILGWIEKYPALKDGSRQPAEPNAEIDRMLDAINSSIIRLQMLLDNKKRNHKIILDNVTLMKDLVNKKTFNTFSISKFKEYHDKIVEILKKISKEERQKIIDIFK